MNVRLITDNLQLFFLIFARIFALMQVAPLLSSEAIPQIVKITLSLFTSIAVMPWMAVSGYPVPENGLEFVFLLVGEAAVGVIMGLILDILYSAFLTSGQFFSMQMGFGASEVYDPLAQMEIPLIGQFLNLAAMFIFLSMEGFQKVFLNAVLRSFKMIRPWELAAAKDGIVEIILKDLGYLFSYSFVIALPVLGTLMIVSVTMGLLAKASPQMNLLMLGFPINISVAYIVLFLAFPIIVQVFAKVIDLSFELLNRFITVTAAGGPA